MRSRAERPIPPHSTRLSTGRLWLGASTLLVLSSSAGQAMPDRVRIPIVKAHDASDPPDPGVFSHWLHGEFRCYACHPAVFPQQRRGFTHADMKRGAYCGACHNGRVAWLVDDDRIECETCHVAAAGTSHEDVDVDDLFKE